ncbi:MAG: Na(+)/H(+) antiporter subunit D [Oceanococcus sp.]
MIDCLLHPGYQLIIAGLLASFLGARAGTVVALAAPLLAIATLFQLPDGHVIAAQFGGYELLTLRLDRLSFIFALIFLIASFLGQLFAMPENRRTLRAAGLVYAGAAVSATLAGDLISLFIHWELTALASVLIVWDGQKKPSDAHIRAGIRYFLLQILSGLLLLVGAVMWIRANGSGEFNHIGLDAPGGLWIFLAFGIKCAFPLMHNWLQDAYPRASAAGTVMLSAFTTKLAVYALARGYAGTESLMWIGAIMTAFPIFFAVLENDLRKVLAYSLNNQLGFMVAGIGIGTSLAIDGAAAHAFAHILYKALLFMSMGAVLHRVGTTKASELGGLYRSMPWTARFCIIGSLSISAFPFFSGFVTKSMILSAAAMEHHMWLWLVLLFASAGVLDHSGIKIPYFSFFAHDSGKRCKEAPFPMLLAMGITAAFCIGIGIWPEPLYALLPFGSQYQPYTPEHVVGQYQLLFFAALAFVTLTRLGWYPAEVRGINLDSDWFYRRFAARLWHKLSAVFFALRSAMHVLTGGLSKQLKKILADGFAENQVTAVWPIHVGASLLLMLLGAWLLLV